MKVERIVRRHKRSLIITAAALAALALYLVWSATQGNVGFPLDDGWIHQTYARNLVEYGEWSFVPGRPSAGSTAPAWTLLLGLGYLLRVPFRIWAYALGGLSLAGTALFAARLTRRIFPNLKRASFLAGLACALEWHLVWAAGSGMETALFALLVLAMFDRMLARPIQRPLLTGVLGGILVLTRPEGVLVVGLVGLGLFVDEATHGRWPDGLKKGFLLGAGTALVVAPYLALNLYLSGTLWPNTFYAKQAEYAVILQRPLVERLLQIAGAPLIGAQALLVPGLLWSAWRRAQSPREEAETWWPLALVPLIWAAATVVLYATRLPVVYQHGRYLIPVIPVLLIYGLAGTLDVVRRARRHPIIRILTRALLASLAILFLAFLIRGAQAYATDVAIIEGEMVTVARWLDANTPSDALVAAHDIGAIGYFARRPLLDMAGLISPEVIPFIRDEEALLNWLREEEADYLVTFPSWYPTLTGYPGEGGSPHLREVFVTGAEVTRAQGKDNMAIYALEWE